MSKQFIVNFSGGKDSTAMLLMMIEKGVAIERVVMVDTTKEFPAMYRHVEKVKKHIAPLEIEILPLEFDYWFYDHVKTKGKRKGEKGYGFPYFTQRWCTARKRWLIKEFLKREGLTEAVCCQGIAVDEQRRIKGNQEYIWYPLVEWGVTEAQALAYCYAQGFDWEGLYERFARVSCWCCPFSRMDELRVLYWDFPDLWKELEQMGKRAKRRFRNTYSVEELSKKFAQEGRRE